jgi:hypothetical protein
MFPAEAPAGARVADGRGQQASASRRGDGEPDPSYRESAAR